MWTRVVAILGLVSILGAGGCSEKDPFEALLADLEEAAEDRDADDVVGHLAEGFTGPHGLTRMDAAASLRRYFAAYETVSLEVYDVTVGRLGETARLEFRVDFHGRALQIGGLAGFLPPSAMYRFDLQLSEVEGDWRITSADWEEVLPRQELAPQSDVTPHRRR